ncbi:MAG: hypothetical protein K8I27_14735 [Planctomycetes bacterium]|nr:hypothetical protein [Planctomycetota bacterium]
MRKLILPAMMLSLVVLGGCHHHDEESNDNDFDYQPVVPSGGLDWGLFNHFEHDYASFDINSGSDQDGFEFDLAEDSVVVITTTGYGGFDAFLDLYDSNFGFITSDDNGGPSPDAVLVGTLNAGSYFVVVGGSGGSTGDYDIDISVEPLGGSDFGGMYPTDSFLDNGGVIDDPFDVDSYVFTIYGNDTVDIYVVSNLLMDSNLELLDEYGSQIAFIDPLNNDDPFILAMALTPGTYIARVGSSSGGDDYSVQIDVN